MIYGVATTKIPQAIIASIKGFDSIPPRLKLSRGMKYSYFSFGVTNIGKGRMTEEGGFIDVPDT